MVDLDVAIVGRGILGALIARQLTDAGRTVVIVERGQPVTSPPGSHLRNGPLATAGDGYFAAIDDDFEYLDPDAAPRALPGAFETKGDGGMSIAWTNNCPRAVAGVDRPELGPDVDWDSLYARAEEALTVRIDDFDDSVRGRLVSDRLRSPLAEQGRSIEPLPLAGRRIGAQRIHYVAPSDVLDGRPVEHRVGRVDRVELDGERATGVLVDGERFAAAAVVLAAGAIETPILLWRSGLAGTAVGRYASYHPVLIAQVVLEDALSADGPDDPLPRRYIPPTSARPWHAMVLRDTNPLPVADDDRHVEPGRLIEIQAFAPVDPRAEHGLTVDVAGRPHFDVPLSAADEERRTAIVDDVHALARRLGRFRRGSEPAWAPLGTPHLMGTSRMGPVDDGTSAVDLDGRLWGIDNLYVVGNAVIPGRLAVNPTLTAAALAMRTADHIIQRGTRTTTR